MTETETRTGLSCVYIISKHAFIFVSDLVISFYLIFIRQYPHVNSFIFSIPDVFIVYLSLFVSLRADIWECQSEGCLFGKEQNPGYNYTRNPDGTALHCLSLTPFCICQNVIDTIIKSNMQIICILNKYLSILYVRSYVQCGMYCYHITRHSLHWIAHPPQPHKFSQFVIYQFRIFLS